jgi:MoxR-like ATPase
VIVERMTGALQAVQQVLDTEQLRDLQRQVREVYVDPSLIEYSVNVVTASREPQNSGLEDIKRYILYGASPRASINLVVAARALAFVRGRDYVLPQDMQDVALDVIRHRLVLSYEALSDNVSSEDMLGKILDAIPLPTVPLNEHSDLRQTQRISNA